MPIRTSRTAVERLRLEAKARRRSTSMALSACLDAVAAEAGYHHWKHVIECASDTARRDERPQLPPETEAWLRTYCSTGQRRWDDAAATDIVLAVDPKDHFGEGFEELDFLPLNVARPIVQTWLLDEDYPGNFELRDLEPTQRHQLLAEDLWGLLWLRLRVGMATIQSDADVLRRVRDACFHPPQFVWHNGRLLDGGHQGATARARRALAGHEQLWLVSARCGGEGLDWEVFSDQSTLLDTWERVPDAQALIDAILLAAQPSTSLHFVFTDLPEEADLVLTSQTLRAARPELEYRVSRNGKRPGSTP